MARRRTAGKNISGILLLDKPAGLTSNAALQQAKRLFQARKAGHTGSLDPLATGMLPLCFGEATKLSGFLLDADKHYRVRVQLGVTTTTGDSEGEVSARAAVPALDAARLREVLAGFVGDIEQIPPMFSALKRNGQPLYKLAHQGIEVERAPRTVTITALELCAFSATELELDVRCSKGTYIRTLAEDIGAVLGCGAHVSWLRRSGVGAFEAEQMVTMAQLEEWAAAGDGRLEQALLPLDAALAHWPDVRLSQEVAFFLKRGQPVQVPRAPTAGWVKLYTRDEDFLGVGHVLDDGRVAPKRLFRL